MATTNPEQNIFTQLESLISTSETVSNLSLNTASKVLTFFDTPSTSIAILDNGKITSHTISSFPNTNPETLFQACSISKPIGSLAIAKLIEQGHFTPESKVVDLLPATVVKSICADARTEALMRSVTVKQVMSHTAGLSVHGFPGYPIEQHPRESLPNAQAILRGDPGVNTVQVKIIAPPGLDFMYSGGGMTVLQAIVENITSKPFHEVMRELVLEPLGMTRTFYTTTLNPNETNLAEAYYTGVTKCESAYHYQPEAVAAGLWTTPTDLLKAAHALQVSLNAETRVKEDASALLSRDMARQMLTVVKYTMGMTWFCDTVSFGHGGSNNPGYRCNLVAWADLPWNEKHKQGVTSNLEDVRPPNNCGIAVMTNSAQGDRVLWKVIGAICYLKGWPAPPRYWLPIEMGRPFAVDGSVAKGEAEWREYIGDWVDEEKKHHWTIREQEGKPVAGVVIAEEEEPVLVKTRDAATPPHRYKQGKKSIDLVLDGIEVMLRLGWESEIKEGEEPKRTVEVCHHEALSKSVLYRKG